MALYTGTDGDDSLPGSTAPDTILGLEGADTLIGSPDDALDGGAGDDLLVTSWGVMVTTGSGRDTVRLSSVGGAPAITVTDFTPGAGGDRLDLSALLVGVTGNPFEGTPRLRLVQEGADTLVFHHPFLSVPTAYGVALLKGVAASSLTTENLGYDPGFGLILAGTAESDSLTGGERADTLSGGGGNDTLLGLGGRDSLLGGEGDDVLDGGAANDYLDGGLGDDTLSGGLGDDTLVGGGGTDLLLGSPGFDRYVGGTVSFAAATSGVFVLANAPSGFPTFVSVPRIIGSSFADDMTAGSDPMRLDGGAGDDTLLGGAGNDALDGGDGADTLDLAFGFAARINLATTAPQATDAANGLDRLFSIENVLGTVAADTLLGSAAANHLGGGAGNDRLDGRDGADTLEGGAGNDRLDGGAGADRLVGGDDADTYLVDDLGDVVVESVIGSSGDRILATVSYTLSVGVEALTLLGTADLDGTGNAYGDVLTGNAGANHLRGLGGNDTLFGGRGDDTLEGGAGDDLLRSDFGADHLIGGDGSDMVDFGARRAPSRLYLDGTDERGIARANAGAAAEDTYVSIERIGGSMTANDFIWGDAGANALYGRGGNDRLFGKDGADTLDGGDGNDILSGGAGADDLSGGAGADRFTFDSAPMPGAADLIRDFGPVMDELVFSRAAFGLPAGIESLALVAASSPVATDAAPVLLFDTLAPGRGELSFDPDGTGAAAPILVARFLGLLGFSNPTAADIVLIA